MNDTKQYWLARFERERRRMLVMDIACLALLIVFTAIVLIGLVQ